MSEGPRSTGSGTRLDSIVATNLGLGTISYQYDSNHNKTSETFSDSVLQAFNFNTGSNGYDVEDRFIQFNRPNQPGESNVQFKRGAGSPSIGNIIEIDRDGGADITTRTFKTYPNSQSTHQLENTGITGSALQTFDGAGNMTRTHAGTNLTWNVGAGRLATADVAGNLQKYLYDATGRRAWRETNNGTTTKRTVFVYSGPNVIAE